MPSLTLKRTFTPSTIFSFGSALGDSRPTNLENDNTSQTEELILFHENQAINEKKNWSLKQFLFLANWFEWLVPTRATSQLNLLENPVLFDKSNLSLPVQRGYKGVKKTFLSFLMSGYVVFLIKSIIFIVLSLPLVKKDEFKQVAWLLEIQKSP